MLDIYNFSKAIRNHWNVENKLHWQLDFTFRSDENTTMNKRALFNLQIIKKFAIVFTTLIVFSFFDLKVLFFLIFYTIINML